MYHGKMAACAADYLEPYREAVRQHGPGFSATLWSSPEGQRRRFDVMIELAACELIGHTVLDAGCGTGDLAVHLIQRGVKFTRYIGIDAVPEVIAAANNRHLPQCDFHHGDVVHDQSIFTAHHPDVICISGMLNTMDERTARQVVSSAFDAADRTVIFNFLSDRAGPDCLQRDVRPARRFNTVQWIDWALSRTPLVQFTQEYLDGHDATIVMRKISPLAA